MGPFCQYTLVLWDFFALNRSKWSNRYWILKATPWHWWCCGGLGWDFRPILGALRSPAHQTDSKRHADARKKCFQLFQLASLAFPDLPEKISAAGGMCGSVLCVSSFCGFGMLSRLSRGADQAFQCGLSLPGARPCLLSRGNFGLPGRINTSWVDGVDGVYALTKKKGHCSSAHVSGRLGVSFHPMPSTVRRISIYYVGIAKYYRPTIRKTKLIQLLRPMHSFYLSLERAAQQSLAHSMGPSPKEHPPQISTAFKSLIHDMSNLQFNTGHVWSCQGKNWFFQVLGLSIKQRCKPRNRQQFAKLFFGQPRMPVAEPCWAFGFSGM